MSSDDSSIDRDDEGGDPFSQTKVDLDMAKRQKRAMRIREQQKEIEEVRGRYPPTHTTKKETS